MHTFIKWQFLSISQHNLQMEVIFPTTPLHSRVPNKSINLHLFCESPFVDENKYFLPNRWAFEHIFFIFYVEKNHKNVFSTKHFKPLHSAQNTGILHKIQCFLHRQWWKQSWDVCVVYYEPAPVLWHSSIWSGQSKSSCWFCLLTLPPPQIQSLAFTRPSPSYCMPIF